MTLTNTVRIVILILIGFLAGPSLFSAFLAIGFTALYGAIGYLQGTGRRLQDLFETPKKDERG